MNKDLKHYIENHIIPIYDEQIKCHGSAHINYVIRRSLEFAKQVMGEAVNPDMVYVIAAFHDIGILKDRATHELVGAQMLRDDENLRKFFTPDQIETMAQAVEDHRASARSEPRTIYGKIVSSADRFTGIREGLAIMHRYRQKYNPEIGLEETIEESRLHALEKFGENGYARKKMYFVDPEYDKFLADVTTLANDKDAFRKKFLEVIGNN